MTHVDGKLLRYRDGPMYNIICVQLVFGEPFRECAPKKKKTNTPKGFNAVTVWGGSAQGVVISGIQTSGGLLIRFARLFGRESLLL